MEVSLFDPPGWDVSALRDRSTGLQPEPYFTRREPRIRPSGGICKRRKELDHSGPSLNWQHGMQVGCRAHSVGSDPATPREKIERLQWESFSEEDLSQAELLMRACWSDSRAHKMTVSLLVFTRFLAARGVCRALYYTPQTPRVEDFNRHTISGQEEGRDRLPSDAAFQGIADIYREHAKEPRDRLRVAAVAILVVTGFRIGELLTLPLDCEVEEVRGGKADTEFAITRRRRAAEKRCSRSDG